LNTIAHIEYLLETLTDFMDIDNEWAKKLYIYIKAYDYTNNHPLFN